LSNMYHLSGIVYICFPLSPRQCHGVCV
jgi:hypothetical protein